MSPNIGEDFVGWAPPSGGGDTLGMVDFVIFPRLHHGDLPDNSMADAERWAAGLPGPAHAIDDQTAIKVADGTVDIVSEGALDVLCPLRNKRPPADLPPGTTHATLIDVLAGMRRSLDLRTASHHCVC